MSGLTTGTGAGYTPTYVLDFEPDAAEELMRAADVLVQERDNARLHARSVDARHEAAWHYLTELQIPERCASGTLLTLAQRVVLALAAADQEHRP